MFTDHFYPELGGIQDSVMSTASDLGRRGHTVEIFAPRHPPADFARSGHPIGEPDLGPNVTVHRRVSVPVRSSTQQSRAVIPCPLSTMMHSGARRPDVIHSHSFFGLGLEALFASRMLSVPVVGTNHTNVMAFGPYIPVSVERAAAWVAWYYNHCEAVTAPSRAVFAELGLARMRHQPVVVSNPIDTECFRPRDIRAEDFGLRAPVITYAGRLGAEKNIESILHALALLPDGPTLALAGHGAQEHALRRLAAELGISDRVAFLGTLDKQRLACLFSASALFVMMSTSETQSMASLQAMACGVPVIAPDQGPLAEFVTTGNGRLVSPHDPAALARAIADLLADPDRRAMLGEAAHRLAQHHSIAAVTDSWESLYRSLLPQNDIAWSAT